MKVTIHTFGEGVYNASNIPWDNETQNCRSSRAWGKSLLDTTTCTTSSDIANGLCRKNYEAPRNPKPSCRGGLPSTIGIVWGIWKGIVAILHHAPSHLCLSSSYQCHQYTNRLVVRIYSYDPFSPMSFKDIPHVFYVYHDILMQYYWGGGCETCTSSNIAPWTNSQSIINWCMD